MVVTIYSFLNDILYKKTGKTLDKKDNESELKPFLLQRWISMYNAKGKYTLIKFLNETTNKVWKAFDDKETWYRAMISVIPRMKYEKLHYIKRNQNEKDPTKNIDDIIDFLAREYKLSKREVKMYIDTYKLDISSIKRSLRS